MDKKLGVYICTGCSIGDSLDIEKLSNVATKAYKLPVCKTHACLCAEDGIQFIKNDCEAEFVTTVIICACSQRVNQDIFNFGSDRITERVNLREHVVWSQPANHEDTQAMAEDYLRMGIVRAQKAQVLDPYKPAEEINKTVLVVGGGITGMTAAIEAAKAGTQVVLVEKESTLGGFSAKLHKHFPVNAPYDNLQTPPHEAMIKEVNANTNIKVWTSAKIEKISGSPGLFDVQLNCNDGMIEFRVGAIVLAAGFVPYDASKLTHLGFGLSPNVITNVQMEELAKNGKILRTSDGKQAKNIAFIQCAGSRDKNHLPYCSSFCCMTSLKQALYVRQQDADAAAYIFYKDMRTMGQHEDFYIRAQEDEGIFLTKGEVVGVEPVAGDRLMITAEDTLLGERIQVEVDIVVLATGMVPATGIEIAACETIIIDATSAEGATSCEQEQCKAETSTVPNENAIIRSDILNLEYRQGTELPQLRYGFPDSHFICFPYETRRTGIYAAGCVRHPMDIGACMDDACGAALKAIQCVELTSQGKAVHPRVGDMSYTEFFMQRCTQCKRCTDECPFGAINEDEKFNPLPNPTRCRRCGTCMGACPERIISFKDYSIDIISSMMKAIEVPEEDEEKPRILVFMCENDAVPALDLAGAKRLIITPYIRVIPVRCLGSVHLVWITDALSKGIDGILLIGCKHGDDYQCHFVKGSELANTRLSKVKETLDRLRLESERVKMVQLSINEYSLLPGIFSEFMETIERVGPNPFKGF
jgi:quinone-modifying oxidoreductase subunit QmoB